jgi:hypothetical protein
MENRMFSLAPWRRPGAHQMPDIEVGYAVAPTADSQLVGKGAGETGTEGYWSVSAGP